MGITPKNPADFDPTMGNYKDLRPFRFWCQKVLPLVYDDSLSYYEVLCKVVDYLNKAMEDIGVLHDDVDALHTAYQQLQSYVNDYFSTLDVQQEINNKLDVMAEDGTLDALLLPYFNAYKTEINGIVAEQNQRITTEFTTQNQRINSEFTSQNQAISSQNEEIGVLKGRMDSFSSLTEGSTTGDAELADIRVGVNGLTYDTAGNAVRGQIRFVESQINELQSEVGGDILPFYYTVNTMVDSNGDTVSPPTGAYFIEVSGLDNVDSITITFEHSLTGYVTHWFNQIDVNNSVIDYTPFYSETGDNVSNTINLSYLCKKIRFSVRNNNGNFTIKYSVDGLDKKIQINSRDIETIFNRIGGDIPLSYYPIYEMLDTNGDTQTVTTTNRFYEIDELHDATSISLILESVANAGLTTHWLNQLDENDNVLSYTPIYTETGDNVKTTIALTSGCKKIKISIWKANGDFSINFITPALEDQVRENTTNIDELINKVGGDVLLNYTQVHTIIGTDGTEKTDSYYIQFYEVTDLHNATSVVFTCDSVAESGLTTHWCNQIDENDNVISYTPFYSPIGENVSNAISLLPDCKKLKVSVWRANGNFTLIGKTPSEITGGVFNLISGLGDSITQGYSQDGDVTETYQMKIANALGARYQNLGIASTPICPNSDYTGGQNENAFVYRYGSIDSDSDFIIVAGGTNDFRHNVPLGTENDSSSLYEQTFYGALEYLIQGIIADHTGVKLVFVTPFHQVNDTQRNTAGFYLSDYIDAIKKKCIKYGLPCIDGFANSGISLNPNVVAECFTDTIHPNQAGHDLIYRNLMPYFAMV